MKKKIKQKHAIRKYKAGASSVLLGLFVFLGLMTEEKAKAAEIIPGQSEMTKKKTKVRQITKLLEVQIRVQA